MIKFEKKKKVDRKKKKGLVIKANPEQTKLNRDSEFLRDLQDERW